jgi:hypothetical protein
MPYCMDRHDLSDATVEDVVVAHLSDLEMHDVKYVSYWFDYDRSSVFCLIDAPDETQERAGHEASHGLTASDITPVVRGTVEMSFGRIVDPTELGDSRLAFHAIISTDMKGSIELGGHRVAEMNRAGGGIMSSFSSVTDEFDCSIAVQKGIQSHDAEAPDDDGRFRVRIGIGAGELVTEHGDLFGGDGAICGVTL